MRARRLAMAIVGLAAVACAAKVGGIEADERTSLGASELVKSHAIAGEDVYRALLRVWLGDNPTSAGLKKTLLGQAQ